MSNLEISLRLILMSAQTKPSRTPLTYGVKNRQDFSSYRTLTACHAAGRTGRRNSFQLQAFDIINSPQLWIVIPADISPLFFFFLSSGLLCFISLVALMGSIIVPISVETRGLVS